MNESHRDDSRDRNRVGLLAILGGGVSAFVSAIVMVFLLAINGAIALALLTELAKSDESWLQRKGVLQFCLFTLPLVFLVIQWMAWDRFRSLLDRRSAEKD